MSVISSPDFRCTLCLSDNTENLATKIYGHCHQDTEIGKRAEWIHGVCQTCFKSFEIQCLTCFTCRQNYLDHQIITVNSKGVVTEIDSLSSERKEIAFIKNAESWGEKIGGLVATVTAVGVVVGGSVVAGLAKEGSVLAEIVGEVERRGALIEGTALEALGLECAVERKGALVMGVLLGVFGLECAVKGMRAGKKVGGLIGSIVGQVALKTMGSCDNLLESIEEARSCGLHSQTNKPNWLE